MSPRLVVLGSASPRRREILESLRVPHVVFAAAVDEDVLPGERPDAYLVRVVRAKLVAVRAALPADLRARATAILVADTSVLVGDAILGKPADAHDARRMIERLAGRTHEVHTRFALASVDAAGFLHEETVRTRVTFRALTPGAVRAYAESGEGMDKAGGYAVQGLGAGLVARIEGSYTNVVGLPACEVVVALEAMAC
jgi:septum formation protein